MRSPKEDCILPASALTAFRGANRRVRGTGPAVRLGPCEKISGGKAVDQHGRREVQAWQRTCGLRNLYACRETRRDSQQAKEQVQGLRGRRYL
jgi:hypothetical protein